MSHNKKFSFEYTKKQKDSQSKEKKLTIPKETTNFLQNTLVEYKKIGKTSEYKITHKSKLIPYNDYTGLNLKEICVQPRDSWREGDKRLEERLNKKIEKNAEAINEIKDLLISMHKSIIFEINSIKTKMESGFTKINDRIDNLVVKNNLKE